MGVMLLRGGGVQAAKILPNQFNTLNIAATINKKSRVELALTCPFCPSSVERRIFWLILAPSSDDSQPE